MTAKTESGLQIIEIPVERLRPNPWNQNQVPADLYEKLRAYIDREGFVEPLVARSAGEDGLYEILGGSHRWKIAKELAYRTVPCVVVELDDHRAKILSINLNELKGQSVPSLLAQLVHDLSKGLSLEDLETQLPYSLDELEDLQDLLRVPDGLELQLAEEAERMERERPRVLSFVVSPEQERVVESAIESALAAAAGTVRGAALTHLAQAFLDGQAPEGGAG